ncbi:MAG: CRTAC1 family protein [Acidobacteriota bacterium]|nr:CRTAC1 family protein [Acidobacteriota bacterium]
MIGCPILLALAFLACTVTASHAQSSDFVRQEFAARCEKAKASNNVFFGEGDLERLRHQLEATTSAPAQRAQGLLELAYHLVRLDRQAQALAPLQEARRRLQQGGAPPSSGMARATRRLEGLAHLQLAENLNCVALHSPTSCILPIGPDAVHPKPEEARLAGEIFREVALENPTDIAARWLLNISRMLSGDYPEGVPPELRLPRQSLQVEEDPSLPEFVNAAERLGLSGEDLAGGAVLEDLDGDGLLDIVTSAWHPCSPMRGYRNTGKGGYEDVSARWGLDQQLGGLNLIHADYDNDGARDLLLLRGAWQGSAGRVRNSLLHNEIAEGLGFVDVTSKAGLAYPAYPTQAAAWADFDLDGDLDLAIANEADDIVIDASEYRNVVSRSYPLQLFVNQGNGRFRDVGRAAGLVGEGLGKGLAWGDFDDDGDPDLYVSNLGENRLYRNDRDQGFTDVTHLAPISGVDRRTFATWFFDQDNDGDLDLFVASYNVPADAVSAHYLGLDYLRRTPEGGLAEVSSTPILLRNVGGRFEDASEASGFSIPVLAMGANFGDVDNDGLHDIYLGTGMPDFFAISPNVFFRGTEAGFVDQTLPSGLGHLAKGHGVAFGDLDHDGDQDILQQLGGAFPSDTFRNALWVNRSSEASPNRWITLLLQGVRANRDAIGARVAIHGLSSEGAEVQIHRVVSPGGSFGASSLRLETGLGTVTRIRDVEVQWPGGQAQRLGPLDLDSFYRVVEGEPPQKADMPRVRLTGIAGHGH